MGAKNGEDDMIELEAEERTDAGESEPPGYNIAEGDSANQGAQTAEILSAWPGSFSPPPTLEEATLALQDLKNILQPP